MWQQVYDPFGHAALSTLCAALPIAVLLGGLAFLRIKAHWAALLGLATSLAVATVAFGMPVGKAAATAVFGAAYGLLPIGWIILNVIFMYNLTVEAGLFEPLKSSLTRITGDARLQLVLIAFCFGAFFEGAAGFGTPVAVTAAILIGLGFSPLAASGLSLIANTAPVAFGALGTPIFALEGVTGIGLRQLSAMVGRQTPFFSVIVPFWLVWAFTGLRGMLEVWPALLVAGISFAVPQFLISNLHGPTLVDVIASVASIAATVGLLRLWRPRRLWPADGTGPNAGPAAEPGYSRGQIARAWVPWAILTITVFVWGLPPFKALVDPITAVQRPVPGLHEAILRVPPVVTAPHAEQAVWKLNWLSTTGTGILVAAVVSGYIMRLPTRRLIQVYWATIRRVRFSLLTVAAMLALGYVTRYSGLDATLGLAFARTGCLYPFFGSLLGWLGVALTGSDTSSNVLFGSLQVITAQQIGLSPVLMAAANSSAGVMGKMIDAQSIVVASTATRWYGQEGRILRFVFFHSLALACLVGLLVLAQAYVFPFTRLVVR